MSTNQNLLQALTAARLSLASASEPYNAAIDEASSSLCQIESEQARAQAALNEAESELELVSKMSAEIKSPDAVATFERGLELTRKMRDNAKLLVDTLSEKLNEARATLVKVQRPVFPWLEQVRLLEAAVQESQHEVGALNSRIRHLEQNERDRRQAEEESRNRCSTCNDDPKYGYCRDCDMTR